jgi:PAS domain S-box-containing protein
MSKDLRNEAPVQTFSRDMAQTPPVAPGFRAGAGPNSETAALLAAIVESSDDAIISKDLSGIITGWNKAAEKMFGYDADEALGQPIRMIIPPERADEEGEILERIHNGQKVDHFETVRLRKDGTRLHISVTISPIRDAEGRIVGASKIARDVTHRRETEDALREGEARFRSTIRQIPDYAIFSTDPTGIIKNWNEGCKKVLGYDESSFVGMKALRLFVPEDIAAGVAEKELRHAAEHGTAGNDRWMLRASGERFWASGTTTALKDGAGRLLGFTKVMRDLTERQRAEQEIQRSMTRLRFFSDTARNLLETGDPGELLSRTYDGLVHTYGLDCYFHFGLEPHSNCLRLRTARGLSPEHAQEIEKLEFGEPISGVVAREIKPMVLSNVQESKDPLTAFIRKLRITAYACHPLVANGQLLGTLSFGTHQHQTFTSDLIGVIGTLTDMVATAIARKRAEEKVTERARLLDLSRDAIIVRDPEHRVLYWNRGAEAMYGWTEQEARGKVPYELLRSRFPEPIEKVFEKFNAENYWEGEVTQTCREGKEITVLARWAIDRDKNGRTRGVLQTHTDITHRKRMAEELARAHADLAAHAHTLHEAVIERTAHLQRTIAELEGISYSLSHDMRAPLRTIQSFSQIVLSEAAPKLTDLERELLEKSISAASRLDRLIQDVLVYTRVARGTIQLSPVDVEPLLRQIIYERPELQPPNAEVGIESPLGRVCGHEAHLTQCITNFLDNAVKFVAPGVHPKIRIWSERTNDQVRLWFEDNGIGVPKDAHDRIFGIFQRVHDEKTYHGTGIGLAIVRKAVERMGGTVGVESEPGQGSRFWIQLLSGD